MFSAEQGRYSRQIATEAEFRAKRVQLLKVRKTLITVTIYYVHQVFTLTRPCSEHFKCTTLKSSQVPYELGAFLNILILLIMETGA